MKFQFWSCVFNTVVEEVSFLWITGNFFVSTCIDLQLLQALEVLLTIYHPFVNFMLFFILFFTQDVCLQQFLFCVSKNRLSEVK